MLIDRLIDKIKEKDNPSVAGLDTCIDYLPDDVRGKCETLYDAAKYITDFNFALIDAIKDVVPAVKVQVAYYEMYGVEGMRAFSDTLAYARQHGLFTIADVKRNDIGSTASAYSNAYLGETVLEGSAVTPFESDFVTVNGYLGSDGVLPFVADCKKNDRGIFVLVKTSNPGSGELQNRLMDNGKTLYENMACLVDEWGADLRGKYGYSSVGAVVGATHKAQAEAIRKAHPNLFFLIPGYGAQGGKAEDIAQYLTNANGGVVNSSRAILLAYKKQPGVAFDEAAYNECVNMKGAIADACAKL